MNNLDTSDAKQDEADTKGEWIKNLWHTNKLMNVACYFICPLVLVCMKLNPNCFFARSHSLDAHLYPINWNSITEDQVYLKYNILLALF